jgi:prepilin-type N-terminal cleavage/methylation domain-containing protein
MMRRRGLTLAEMMITVVIVAMIGAALTRLYVAQARSYDLQTQLRLARFVSRTGINAAISDLRMVEATGGVVSATNTSVTVRVPYAMGIVCANTAALTTIALLPVDSVAYATAGFTGYAWRDSLGAYHYVETGTTLTAGTASLCTTAHVTVLSGGLVVAIAPALPSTLPAITAVGTPVFLTQRLTYSFAPSVTLPGRTALWRTVIGTGETDELVAPFAPTAEFKFFIVGSDSAQTAVPSPLTTMRGIELVFNAQSERTPQGQPAVMTAQITTGVFFNNLLK